MQLRWRTRALLAGGLLAITSGCVLGATGMAMAEAETMPPPAGDTTQSTDDTVTTDVAALVTTDTDCAMADAPTFDNGRGGSNQDLHAVNLEGGDTLTMSWTVGPGCDTTNPWPDTVTLAVYHGATDYAFDPNIDQTLIDSASCGGDAGACTVNDGVYSLSLAMPGEECFAQVDAVHGDALPIVGPSGDYYGFGHEVSRLISAGTVVNDSCEAPTTTTEAPTTTTAPVLPPTESTTTTAPVLPPTESTTTTAPVLPPTESTTTTAPVLPPTESTTTTAPVLPPTESTTTTAAVLPQTESTTTTAAVLPQTESTSAAAVIAPAAVGVEAASVTRQLPVTGAHTGVLVLLGTSLIMLGGAALLAVRAQNRSMAS